MSEESARGSFVWHDLMTTDPEAAKAFYTAVVGWGTQMWDGPSSTPYMMWTIGGTPIAGSMKIPDAAVAGGARPHWLAYVSVPDVDATVAKAQSLGAGVMMPGTDIPTVGRFAILTDPQGAMIAPFKPEKDGQEPAAAPRVGEFSWHELTTTDQEAAFAFYHELFGWEKIAEHDMGAHGIYQLYGHNGRTLGGMFTRPPGMPNPPAWLHYARVPDIQAAAEAIRSHGGQVLHGPMEVPGGDWVVMGMDPQGGPFAVHQSVAQNQTA